MAPFPVKLQPDGRISVPMAIRDKLGLESGDELPYRIDPNSGATFFYTPDGRFAFEFRKATPAEKAQYLELQQQRKLRRSTESTSGTSLTSGAN